MKNESDTPLTDAVTFDLEIVGDARHKRISYPDGMGDLVDADFARTLERRCKVLEEELNDFFAKNSETHSGRAQILERRCKRLEEALRKLKDQAEWHGPNPHVDQVERAHFKNALEQARTALAEQKEEKI